MIGELFNLFLFVVVVLVMLFPLGCVLHSYCRRQLRISDGKFTQPEKEIQPRE